MIGVFRPCPKLPSLAFCDVRHFVLNPAGNAEISRREPI